MSSIENKRTARDATITRGIFTAAACVFGLGVMFAAYNWFADTSSALDQVEVAARSNGELHVLFRKTDAGDISILSAEDNRVLKKIPEKNKGFIDPLMRSLSRERMRHGADQMAPFSLRQNEYGHISIIDPLTGTNVYLRAFGRTNIALFTDIVKKEGLSQ